MTCGKAQGDPPGQGSLQHLNYCAADKPCQRAVIRVAVGCIKGWSSVHMTSELTCASTVRAQEMGTVRLRSGLWPPRMSRESLPHPGTHILLFLIRQQPGHLLPFSFNFFFIIVKFPYNEPSKEQLQLSLRTRSRQTLPRDSHQTLAADGPHPYLFSLALTLKSSATLRKRVTVKRPASLSSAISLKGEAFVGWIT